MAYKCHNCDNLLMSLRLGYCPNCREPISSDILPEAKKQSLLQAEREYEEMRERLKAEKDAGKSHNSHSHGSYLDAMGASDRSSDPN